MVWHHSLAPLNTGCRPKDATKASHYESGVVLSAQTHTAQAIVEGNYFFNFIVSFIDFKKI